MITGGVFSSGPSPRPEAGRPGHPPTPAPLGEGSPPRLSSEAVKKTEGWLCSCQAWRPTATPPCELP